MDDRKRVIHGTGLKKAQDFQLKHTADKRAQGKAYTDPKRAEESFMDHAEQFILKSARIQAGENELPGGSRTAAPPPQWRA